MILWGGEVSKSKYGRGRPIYIISDFDDSDSLWFKVRFGNKVKTLHRSFLESWPYRTLLNKIEQGEVYEAFLIDEKDLYFKKRWKGLPSSEYNSDSSEWKCVGGSIEPEWKAYNRQEGECWGGGL